MGVTKNERLMESGQGEEKWKMGKEERPKAKERYDCVISSLQRNEEM
jgi:hypothetical protein